VHVKKVILTNYRNYTTSTVELTPGRNILIGDNAQGKTNFLESIEYVSQGSSWRANQDLDLIRFGSADMRIEVDFEANGSAENILIGMRRNITGDGMNPDKDSKSIDKIFKLNGLSQPRIRSITHRLVAVSFKSHDLNLLRSGPKYRRDWIDGMLSATKTQYKRTLTGYQKIILQRNRLLKQLFEKGRISVSDNEQLKTWDEQCAQYGAQIIKERIALINTLLPVAESYQATISSKTETLSCRYQFKRDEQRFRLDEDNEEAAGLSNEEFMLEETKISSQELEKCSHQEVVSILMRYLKAARFEEIRRKQTLVGPHRDDLTFFLNEADAVHFASQGQQRSLVLAFKLAELKHVSDFLNESPILLLDDVLAELDLDRQSLLMGLVAQDMQTIITTTHLDGFKAEWLAGASFLRVKAGQVTISDPASALQN
jgi:DNA replication and repair protein RecF